MRSNPPRAAPVRPERPLKLLLWALVASLVFGALDAGMVLEDALRTVRNSLHEQKASGDIVLVAVDDASLRKVGEWPWPRSTQAKLIDEATRLGAKQVLVDIIYDNPTLPMEDQALADAIKRSGRVVLPVRERLGTQEGVALTGRPLPAFANHAALASISAFYNYQHAVWRLPFYADFEGRKVPSFAAEMADVSAIRAGEFRLDYSIDIGTIPTVSAESILAHRVPAQSLRGKTVVIGLYADQLADRYWIPGVGRNAGSYTQIIGAETLKTGTPVDLGWLLPLLGTSTLLALALLKQARTRNLLLGSVLLLLAGIPLLLEAHLVFVDVVPSLFALSFVTVRDAWLRWRSRGLTNVSSGLPNLEAFRARRDGASKALIAARIHNYAEIASALAADEEQELVRQIADRLSIANEQHQIFQGDEGIFGWLIDSSKAVGNHLEALHALFRAPMNAGGRTIDIAISFGGELGSDRSISNRLGSALVAADQAWADGLKWKLHDPARDEEVSWRLSLLSRLDAAVDSGEVWLAYQPQLDLGTNQIVGAEALARWTHPEKGPISPAEFIAAAEAHGRIGKLTDFVLERAVSTAAAINRRGTPFSIAVNLSARLLADRQLVQRIERILTIHGLEPHRLTLELTETAAINESDHAIALLDRLKSLGLRIAIDDYGTGLSTLDYLKKVPADEIKIDQSFVRAIRVNRSDLIMVQSTIALAHSLDRKVVAEGVEDRQVLEDLRTMDCDLAQGFVIGRPMSVRELVGRLATQQHKRVA